MIKCSLSLRCFARLGKGMSISASGVNNPLPSISNPGSHEKIGCPFVEPHSTIQINLKIIGKQPGHPEVKVVSGALSFRK